MKLLPPSLIVLLALLGLSGEQTNGGVGTNLPGTCAQGSLYMRIGFGPYWCETTNTWTAVGGGAGGAAWGSITGTLSAQTDLQTALDGKQAAGTYATGTGSATGTNTGDQTSVSGNAGTATALQNARTINGVSFNGTANITVTAAGSTLSDSVPLNRGGTGQTGLGSSLQVLRTNAAGNATEWGSIAGGSVPSYTLHVQALTSAPVDAQTVYFGQTPAAPTTTQGTRRIYIRKAGTIRQVNIFSFSGTVGTNEAWPCNVRLNNTGDTLIASVALATAERTWFNANLGLAVTTSDYIEIKCVSPTWVTNPNTWIPGGYLVIEY